jgi:hypothetical protein
MSIEGQQGASAPDEAQLIDQFSKGEISLRDLPQGLQDQLLNGSAVEQPVEEPTATDPQPPQEAEPVEEPTQEEPAEEPKPEAEKKQKRQKKSVEELRKLALERADKINALQQQQKAHEHRLRTDAAYRAEYFQKLGVEAPAVAGQKVEPSQVWTDEHQVKTAQTLAEMKAELDTMRKEREMSRLYSDLEKFATKEVGHQFDAPVSEIDRAVRLLEATSGKEPSREDIAALGFDDADVEVYDRFVKVTKFQSQSGYPTFESAWHDYGRLHGQITRKAVQKPDAGTMPDLEEADRVARRERMEKALQTPKLMTTQRALQADQGMTPDFAQRWLATHPEPRNYNDEDRQTWGRIQKLLGI